MTDQQTAPIEWRAPNGETIRLYLKAIGPGDSTWQGIGPAVEENLVVALVANPELRQRVISNFWSPEEIAENNKRATELWQAIGEPELKRRLAETEASLTKEAAKRALVETELGNEKTRSREYAILLAETTRQFTHELERNSTPSGGSTREDEHVVDNDQTVVMTPGGAEATATSKGSEPPGEAYWHKRCDEAIAALDMARAAQEQSARESADRLREVGELKEHFQRVILERDTAWRELHAAEAESTLQRDRAERKVEDFRDAANSLLGHLSNEPDTEDAKHAWERLERLINSDFPDENGRLPPNAEDSKPQHTCTATATLAFGLPPPCPACLADPKKFTPQSELDKHNAKSRADADGARFPAGQRVRNRLAPTDLGTVLATPSPEFAKFGDHVEWDRTAGASFYVTHSQLAAVDDEPNADPEPAQDKPVMLSKLVAALKTSGNEAMRWLARELSRLESGGAK